jgi:anti-anti-sigma regulatory factor
MEITTDQPSPDLAVIGLTGELDGSNFEQVIDAGRAACDGGARRIVLDLSRLTYMGSSGLVAIHSISLLLRGQEPPSPENGWQAIHDIGSAQVDDSQQAPLLLVGPPPSIERVLQRSGMLGLFPVHADRASAVDAATVA